MHMGNLLKEVRKSRGWTQKQLAEKIYMNYNTYRKYEYMEEIKNFWMLYDVCFILKVPISIFLVDRKKITLEGWGEPLSVGYFAAKFEASCYYLNVIKNQLMMLEDKNDKKYYMLIERFEKEYKVIRTSHAMLLNDLKIQYGAAKADRRELY